MFIVIFLLQEIYKANSYDAIILLGVFKPWDGYEKMHTAVFVQKKLRIRFCQFDVAAMENMDRFTSSILSLQESERIYLPD